MMSYSLCFFYLEEFCFIICVWGIYSILEIFDWKMLGFIFYILFVFIFILRNVFKDLKD